MRTGAAPGPVVVVCRLWSPAHLGHHAVPFVKGENVDVQVVCQAVLHAVKVALARTLPDEALCGVVRSLACNAPGVHGGWAQAV